MSAQLTVVGDGVVGLALGLQLARVGWRVEVVGAGSAGSASEIAAGMLAPASEALLDGADPTDAAVLSEARRRWDVWADLLDVAMDRAGALHVGPTELLQARAEAAVRTGLSAVMREDGLHLPEDALVHSEAVLARLAAAAGAAGARLRTGRVSIQDGRMLLDERPLEGVVIVAAGWGSAALAAAAPELTALRPIKGQLLRFEGTAASGPVVRAPGAYLAPGPGGWTVGATMEAGRSDLHPDPVALARLRSAAAVVRPELAEAPARVRAAVRAATPDGRPLLGRSRSGVWLATGMRRNGWLLAPLVAEGIAAYLAGADADAALAGQARAWDPSRVFARGWA